jgi:predicted NodU family carbamoyl transferase
VVSIPGISAFYHYSAACLVVDGNIVAEAQQERFTRIKHDHSFPVNAARYCLTQFQITPNRNSNLPIPSPQIGVSNSKRMRLIVIAALNTGNYANKTA